MINNNSEINTEQLFNTFNESKFTEILNSANERRTTLNSPFTENSQFHNNQKIELLDYETNSNNFYDQLDIHIQNIIRLYQENYGNCDFILSNHNLIAHLMNFDNVKIINNIMYYKNIEICLVPWIISKNFFTTCFIIGNTETNIWLPSYIFDEYGLLF